MRTVISASSCDGLSGYQSSCAGPANSENGFDVSRAHVHVYADVPNLIWWPKGRYSCRIEGPPKFQGIKEGAWKSMTQGEEYPV